MGGGFANGEWCPASDLCYLAQDYDYVFVSCLFLNKGHIICNAKLKNVCKLFPTFPFTFLNMRTSNIPHDIIDSTIKIK